MLFLAVRHKIQLRNPFEAERSSIAGDSKWEWSGAEVDKSVGIEVKRRKKKGTQQILWNIYHLIFAFSLNKET